MALTYQQTYAAQTDPVFLQLVAVSLVKTAQAIITEPTTTALHSSRDLLGRQVLRDPDTWAKRFAINCALAPAIQAGATLSAAQTADIDTQISAIWNSYLGIA